MSHAGLLRVGGACCAVGCLSVYLNAHEFGILITGQAASGLSTPGLDVDFEIRAMPTGNYAGL